MRCPGLDALLQRNPGTRLRDLPALDQELAERLVEQVGAAGDRGAVLEVDALLQAAEPQLQGHRPLRGEDGLDEDRKRALRDGPLAILEHVRRPRHRGQHSSAVGLDRRDLLPELLRRRWPAAGTRRARRRRPWASRRPPPCPRATGATRPSASSAGPSAAPARTRFGRKVRRSTSRKSLGRRRPARPDQHHLAAASSVRKSSASSISCEGEPAAAPAPARGHRSARIGDLRASGRRR